MSKILEIIGVLIIAAMVVIGGVIALPVLAAGTVDPCLAVARIASRKIKKPDLEEPYRTFAVEVAVVAVAARARSHGTLACYKWIPETINAIPQSTNAEFIGNQAFFGVGGKIN